MKKAISIIILIIVLSSVACKNIKPPIVEDANKNPDIVEENKDQKVMDEFLEMIIPENNAADLGIFIRNNIDKVSCDEAEEMLQWLIIYQTEITEEFIEKIYTFEYMEALNEDMEGVLDKDKIKNISDEGIRKDYQKIIDGFMTIIRYEENPVVETDWKELNKLSAYVSDDFGIALELYQKIKNYEYNREELDVVAIAEDMIRIESILKSHKSDFIKTMANDIYNLLSYALLIGPEGSYLDFFIYRDSKEYKDIIKLIDDYPNSILSQIIQDLNNSKYSNPMEVYDKIDEGLQFGIGSNKYMKNNLFNDGDIEYNILEIQIPNDKAKQDRINKIIMDDIHQQVKSFQDRIELSVSIYTIYQDKQYVSYNTFLDYKDIEGNYASKISYRVLDYINEKHISLEEYLDADFNEIKDYLKSTKGVEINTIPEFEIYNEGIALLLDGVEGRDEYLVLNKKDLIPYLSLYELTIKY